MLEKIREFLIRYKFSVITVFIGVLILELLHIHNGFPVLLADSREYVKRGLDMSESSHWSNTYIYFIGININVLKSVQWVPVIQNLVSVSVLYLLASQLLDKYKNAKFLAIIFCLLFSALPWISNLLMSDISTPISIIILMLLFLCELNLGVLIYLFFILFFTASSHQSHIAILPIFSFLAILGNIVAKLNVNRRLLIRNAVLVILVTMSSFYFEKNILNPSDKLAYHQVSKKKGKKGKKAKQVKQDITSGYYFVAVRMWETGQLDKLLESFCSSNGDNYLCDPNNDYPIKVKLNKAVDRTEDNDEYQKFSRDNKEFIIGCLTIPRFYYACALAAIKRSPRLLKKTTIRPYVPIKGKTFKDQIRRISQPTNYKFLRSKQINDVYGFKFLEKYNFMDKIWWLLLLPLTVFFFAFVSRKLGTTKIISSKKWAVIVLLIFGHIVNTVICGTFSNADNVRYSSRTIWIVNLALILLIIFIIEARSKYKEIKA